jgi:hypothetical protein
MVTRAQWDTVGRAERLRSARRRSVPSAGPGLGTERRAGHGDAGPVGQGRACRTLAIVSRWA